MHLFCVQRLLWVFSLVIITKGYTKMFISTATIIITSTTLSLSPMIKSDPEIFYFDDDYTIVAQEYMRQQESNKPTDINDILYKTIADELMNKDKE